MDKEIQLLSKLFSDIDLTEFGKTFNDRQVSKDLTENSKTTSNNDNNTIISNPNTQKLYKRTGTISWRGAPYPHGINNQFWIKQKKENNKIYDD